MIVARRLFLAISTAELCTITHGNAGWTKYVPYPKIVLRQTTPKFVAWNRTSLNVDYGKRLTELSPAKMDRARRWTRLGRNPCLSLLRLRKGAHRASRREIDERGLEQCLSPR